MFEIISLSTRQADWRKDLEQSMFLMGIMREKHMASELMEQIGYLCALLNQYDEINAKPLSANECPNDFLAGIKVDIRDLQSFEAHIRYKLEEGRLMAEICFTKTATTADFPIEEGVEWSLDILKEHEVKDPAYVVANLKNHFIIFLGFQKIGRDVIFSVME